MSQIEDSVVLIQSSDPDSAFGTGFIIARDNSFSYFLTCAHVVERINGKDKDKLKISGLDKSVEVVPGGSSITGIDMALLRVAGYFDMPLLFKGFAIGQEGSDIEVTGYSVFDSRIGQYSKRSLKGKLTNRTKLSSNNQEYPFLDVSIQDNDFCKLEGGYSGSPIYNTAGQVLGVISHRRSGVMGHAFCISNLALLYPDIKKLLPYFEYDVHSLATPSPRTSSRIELLVLLKKCNRVQLSEVAFYLDLNVDYIEQDTIAEYAIGILKLSEQKYPSDFKGELISALDKVGIQTKLN